jgi:hypothetical protein
MEDGKMELPERGDCIHCVVCKFDDQVCPMECGYFEEAGLKAQKEPVLDVHALKEQLDRLLSVVNAVTCPHRHGQPIRPKDLTRLCNRQLDVEEALREMGYDS